MWNLIKRGIAFIKGESVVKVIPTITDYHEMYLKKEKLSYGGKQAFINNITIDDTAEAGCVIFNMKLSSGIVFLIKEV